MSAYFSVARHLLSQDSTKESPANIPAEMNIGTIVEKTKHLLTEVYDKMVTDIDEKLSMIHKEADGIKTLASDFISEEERSTLMSKFPAYIQKYESLQKNTEIRYNSLQTVIVCVKSNSDLNSLKKMLEDFRDSFVSSFDEICADYENNVNALLNDIKTRMGTNILEWTEDIKKSEERMKQKRANIEHIRAENARLDEENAFLDADTERTRADTERIRADTARRRANIERLNAEHIRNQAIIADLRARLAEYSDCSYDSDYSDSESTLSASDFESSSDSEPSSTTSESSSASESDSEDSFEM